MKLHTIRPALLVSVLILLGAAGAPHARADSPRECLLAIDLDPKFEVIGLQPEITTILQEKGYLLLSGEAGKAPFALKLKVVREHIEYTESVGRVTHEDPYEFYSTVYADLSYAIGEGAVALYAGSGEGSKHLYYQSLSPEAMKSSYAESLRGALRKLQSCNDALVSLGLRAKTSWWSSLKGALLGHDAEGATTTADQGADAKAVGPVAGEQGVSRTTPSARSMH